MKTTNEGKRVRAFVTAHVRRVARHTVVPAPTPGGAPPRIWIPLKSKSRDENIVIEEK